MGNHRDHTLIARAFTAKVARWEPFASGGNEGELCLRGLRWAGELDRSGVPALTRNTRAELRLALREAK